MCTIVRTNKFVIGRCAVQKNEALAALIMSQRKIKFSIKKVEQAMFTSLVLSSNGMGKATAGFYKRFTYVRNCSARRGSSLQQDHRMALTD